MLGLVIHVKSSDNIYIKIKQFSVVRKRLAMKKKGGGTPSKIPGSVQKPPPGTLHRVSPCSFLRGRDASER